MFLATRMTKSTVDGNTAVVNFRAVIVAKKGGIHFLM